MTITHNINKTITMESYIPPFKEIKSKTVAERVSKKTKAEWKALFTSWQREQEIKLGHCLAC